MGKRLFIVLIKHVHTTLKQGNKVFDPPDLLEILNLECIVILHVCISMYEYIYHCMFVCFISSKITFLAVELHFNYLKYSIRDPLPNITISN